MTPPRRLALSLSAASALLAACSRPAPSPTPAGGKPGSAPYATGAATTPPAAAPADDAPPTAGDATLPKAADRDSLDALKRIVSSNDSAAAPAAASGPLTVADLVLTPPATWRPSQPSSSMRRAQYEIPGTAGPGEAVVYFFGAGQGGGVEDNVARWLGQMTAEPEGVAGSGGKPRETREVGRVKVTVVRARGTYDPGMAMGTASRALPGHAMVGIILESPGGPVFIKITGPAATIDAAAAPIEALIGSVRVAG